MWVWERGRVAKKSKKRAGREREDRERMISQKKPLFLPKKQYKNTDTNSNFPICLWGRGGDGGMKKAVLYLESIFRIRILFDLTLLIS